MTVRVVYGYVCVFYVCMHVRVYTHTHTRTHSEPQEDTSSRLGGGRQGQGSPPKRKKNVESVLGFIVTTEAKEVSTEP